jgi:hypothetical protein
MTDPTAARTFELDRECERLRKRLDANHGYTAINVQCDLLAALLAERDRNKEEVK